VRINIFAIAQVLVDDPALGGIHRWKIDRALVAQRLLRRLFGLLLKLLAAAVTITGGVNLNADPLSVACVALDDSRRKVLNSIDRLSVLTDEEPQILAFKRSGNGVIIDHYIDLSVEIQRVDDLLKQLECALLCLFWCCH
jgi:hypothetical protein